LYRINAKTASTRKALDTKEEVKDSDILAFLLSGSFLSYVADSRAALQKSELTEKVLLPVYVTFPFNFFFFP